MCNTYQPLPLECASSSLRTKRCASTYDELSCLININDKVQLCPGTSIGFSNQNNILIETLAILVPNGREIICPTFDCFLIRKQSESNCPFFTTQAGTGFKLDGITFVEEFSGDLQYATENLVSINNLNGIVVDGDTTNVKIGIQSTFQPTKTKGKGGKGKSSRKMLEVVDVTPTKDDTPPLSHGDVHQNEKKERRHLDAPSPCSSKSNSYVKLFQMFDTDKNGRLDCEELSRSIGNSLITVKCHESFAELSNLDEACFLVDGDELILAPAKV